MEYVKYEKIHVNQNITVNTGTLKDEFCSYKGGSFLAIFSSFKGKTAKLNRDS